MERAATRRGESRIWLAHPLAHSNTLQDAGARRIRGTAGSTLIWVLVVTLVITIVLGMALFAINARMGSAVVHHEERQAYYTALSSLDTLSQWISGSGDPGEVDDFLDGVSADSTGIDIPLSDLPDDLGECTVNARFTDEGHSELLLTATATYAGVTETLSLTMYGSADAEALSATYKVADFGPTAYDKRAGELNALTSGGIVPIYDSSATADNASYNEKDLQLLNTYIPDASSTREARWTNSRLNYSTGANDDNVLGTQRMPINGSGGSRIDTRRFMVPVNGRITIDPLERDGYEGSESNPDNQVDDDNNTRIVSLAIDNTAGKDVLFRLVSGDAATAPGLIIPDSSLFRSLYGMTSPYGSYTTFNNRSRDRYASLLTLNFTDNANSTETLSYNINGTVQSYTWHPNKWNKLDLFVQPGSQVTSNLVVGPFGHKYDILMDYWSWGNFVDNWHGQTAGELKSLWPNLANTTHYDDQGLPVFPLDFGKNAGFWILDGRSDRYFRIMQGANVIEGSIYSNRPTIIGGALVRSSYEETTDHLNRTVDGFADLSPDTHVMYVESTTRYSQLIYNTDIVLKAPSSGAAKSVIRRPATWRDRTNTSSGDKNKDKIHEPTMTIKDGTIYVGDYQELTIEGTVKGAKSGTDSTIVPLNNMWISPDRIVVAPQATLTIKASETTNVLTDIYVDGGTLIIEPGAKIKGNIYCYNEGEVVVSGSFRLDSPHDDGQAGTLTPEEELDGIHIYGEDLVGVVPSITAPGKLVVSKANAEATVISGSSNKVHLLGPFTELVKPTATSDVIALNNIKGLLCDDHDPTDGHCQHFSTKPGGWLTGAYGAGG
jgi:type II secretory pathway pseudopilin PulG